MLPFYNIYLIQHLSYPFIRGHTTFILHSVFLVDGSWILITHWESRNGVYKLLDIPQLPDFLPVRRMGLLGMNNVDRPLANRG